METNLTKYKKDIDILIENGYELQKGLNFVNRNCYKDFPRSIAVIADDTLDATTLRYIKDNNILFYQYDFDSFDLDTLTIRKVDIEELQV